jgi:hypothetical protein
MSAPQGELLPADGPDILPDDELAAALDARAAVVASGTPMPFGRGWAFDFTAGDFVPHGQAPARVSGIDQLKVWAEKCLRTARYAHPVYGDDYGVDDVDLIGRPLTSDLIGMYQLSVEAALLRHDRISDVKDFAYTAEPGSDVLEVTFTIVVDEGDQIVVDTSLVTGGT